MIPVNRDYLIEVAMDAYAEASGQSVSRPWMEAAFNTIAAHIWDEATSAQAEWEWLAERGREGNRPNPQDTNPYRASEAE